MALHNDIGKYGENLALEFLKKHNYIIEEVNWHYKNTEIDIIALKDNLLVIVEVKTRTSTAFGTPENFVTKKKIQNLIRATNAYCQQNLITYEIRFDIISVVVNPKKDEIQHIKDAFYLF